MKRYTEEYVWEQDNENRYVLGQISDSTLICIGLNPSDATPAFPDMTYYKVLRLTKVNNFKSAVMLNLYPYRCEDRKKLPSEKNDDVERTNLKKIEETIEAIKQKSSNKPLTVLASWGGGINKRKYLKDCLLKIYELLQKYNVEWKRIDNKDEHEHPQHPSRAKIAELQGFKIKDYIKNNLKSN